MLVVTTYTYDALNRLSSITNNIGQTTTFTYDALGRRTSMTHDNGVTTTYQYDAASQLLSLVHHLGATTINSFSYSYDKVGNRITKADNNGTANYTYDTLNRLIEAINPLPSNPLESFNYDAVGNRTDSNQNGTSIFNDGNQLTEDAQFTYSYDANGNLVQKTDKLNGDFTTYEYDAENKLIRVVSSSGTTANYKYDGLGRRVEKEVTEAGLTNITRFIYDNEDILLELDGNNQIVARYTHGPGIDEPLTMEKGGESFFYHADPLGSITELTYSVGTIAQSYTYSSFGKIESQLDPNLIQPYGFTGREFDPETGLYFYRARYYDPATGRFLQEDPIGHAGGVNFYTYVINNPVRLIDPWGMYTEVLTFQPVGWGQSSFGHTAVNINGTVYSWGPNGLWTGPFPEFMQRNVFREAVGAVLDLTPDQETRVEKDIKDFAKDKNFNSLTANCSDPIEQALENLGFDLGVNLFPVGLGFALDDAGLVSSYNFYPRTRPPEGSSAPWAR